jgi:creatinine amidohydrolase
MDLPLRLAEITTEEAREALSGKVPSAALVPVGSVEPHGPHLPLSTDTIIGEAAAERACALLRAADVAAFVAPAVPFGVTDFARGFAGAISVAPAALAAFLRAVVDASLAAGFSHVCLVSNHLEPAHDATVRSALDGLAAGKASVASPLTRRWARTLSDEFKSGACHAGRYESSIVMHAAPRLVRDDVRRALADVPISLSEGIRAGKHTFVELGMDLAYSGQPAQASAGEGRELVDKLAEMIVVEVQEGLAAREPDR